MAVTFLIVLNSYIFLLNERTNIIDVISCYEADRENAVTEYRDALWVTMITFMTVGYGDLIPTTYLGRYVQVLTAVGGQLYIALVIGLIHGQLMLTSEESGVNISLSLMQVLNIISNNKKEKTKRYIAASLVYYILKLAGARNRRLQKGEIHWYKSREVANLKFELYVDVMRFKKIKTELANYYATRGSDNTLNIIKSTETNLALLASEVIKIFEFVKDNKLERKKNINESYLRKKSMLNRIIEAEAHIGQRIKPLASKMMSQGTNSMFSPRSSDFINDFDHKLKLEDKKRNIRNSKTLANPGISKFGIQKLWNKKPETNQIEEEDYCYSSSSFSDERENNKKKKKVVINSYKTNINGALANNQEVITGVSLTNRLQERRRQQRINQQLTNITSANISQFNHSASINQSRASQSHYKNWKNITSNESIKALSNEERENKESSSRSLNKGESNMSVANFFHKSDQSVPNSPLPETRENHRKSNSSETKPAVSFAEDKKQESVKTNDQEQETKIPFQRQISTLKINLKDQCTSPLEVMRNQKRGLKRLKTQEVKFSPNRKSSIFKESQKSNSQHKSGSRKGSSSYLKSSTQIKNQNKLKKQLSISNAMNNAKLKQQKTQIHPTLVSIVEEEETYSDEEPEGMEIYNEEDEDVNDDDDQIEEEDSSYETITSESSEKETVNDEPPLVYEIITTDTNKGKSKEVFNIRSNTYKRGQTKNSSMKSLLQSEILNKQRSTVSQNTLGQVFDEYIMRKDLSKQMVILNKIYENYSINTVQRVPKQAKPMDLSQEVIGEYSPKVEVSQSSNRSRMDGKKIPLSDSFFVSEDQRSNSQKSNNTPNRVPKDVQQFEFKNQNTLTVKHTNTMRPPQLKSYGKVKSQETISQGDNLQLGIQDDESLSPIIPMRKKPNSQFQLDLRKAPISNNSEGEILNKHLKEDDLNKKTQDHFKKQESLPAPRHQKIQLQGGQLDLQEIFESVSNNASLSQDQKQSLHSFYEQINQILQVQQLNIAKVPSQTSFNTINNQQKQMSSPKFSTQSENLNTYNLSNEKLKDKQETKQKKNEKELLIEEIKQEDIKMENLIEKVNRTETVVNKTLNEVRFKIQKLKATQNAPTFQVNFSQSQLSKLNLTIM